MKKIHIPLIVVGTIFVLLSAFHTSLWFDETYSVALVNHSFKDIFTIGAADVHPLLYYYCLKILNIIFGSNIIVYRLFSCLCVSILGILGYTHIRKITNDKVGILFTYFSFFLPVITLYATEIRMYTLGIIFITLTAYYAYKIIKEGTNKDYILFTIFSILSAYTHNYGLVSTGIINIYLFIYLLKNKINIKRYIYTVIAQVILYLPWFIILIKQTMTISKGFWITFSFPTDFIKLLQFQFTGLNEIFGLIVCITLYILMFIKCKKQSIGKTSLFIYLTILIIMSIVSLVSPIIVPRYMFIPTGLLIFSLAYFISNYNKYIIIMVCSITLVISVGMNINNIKENYHASNYNYINYINDNIKETDIILYGDLFNSTPLISKINHKQYFYNIDRWTEIKAYKAYYPRLEIIDNIDNIKGRVWIIDRGESRLYNLLKDDVTLIEHKYFQTSYRSLAFQVYLVEK